jgi:hypothetical protein
MENGRPPASRVWCRLARYHLHGNGNFVKEGRRQVSPVIRSLGTRRRAWTRNRNLPGTARARARPSDRPARWVHQVIGIQRGRVAYDQTIKLIPIERPSRLRCDKMIAFGASLLGRSVREHQEQQNGCSALRHGIDGSCFHLLRCRIFALRAGKPAPAWVDRRTGLRRTAQNMESIKIKIYAGIIALQAGLLASRCIPDHLIARGQSSRRPMCNLHSAFHQYVDRQPETAPASKTGSRIPPAP